MTRADRGAQQERTTLAWRRTGLALGVGALTVGRLTVDTLGATVLVPLALVAVLAGWVVTSALRSRRLAREHPQDPRFSVLADARLPLALTVVLAVVGVAELVSALARLR
ncbi:DUF202 domain-containing protein [Nostocoides sp. Soil756]|jgi:putative membrane protein|uniref:DUF202 domain-containing protein n=1 Tax=Nostocoides sp. Soil756 TaxID=1736399 RepID=UPI0006FF96D6|nr:DUF202 domain-containing protein [Tetrasphaera sp. Soil756]KRE61014.1 hypothetical protein ASG78_11695 [Tetrasphaera sp. Soil756]